MKIMTLLNTKWGVTFGTNLNGIQYLQASRTQNDFFFFEEI